LQLKLWPVAQRWNCCTFSFAFISAPKLVLLARFGAFCNLYKWRKPATGAGYVISEKPFLIIVCEQGIFVYLIVIQLNTYCVKYFILLSTEGFKSYWSRSAFKHCYIL
jgi:hypothetical protein